MQRGNTQKINNEIMYEWLYEIYDTSKWTQIRASPSDLYPHTMVRKEGKDALQLYLESFINNKMCKGYGWCHNSVVKNVEDVQECNEAMANHFDIDEGDRYILFSKPLIITLTGDGASKVKNTPAQVGGMSLGFVKPHTFDHGLQQSRHSGVPVLVSRLPDSDDRIAEYMHIISDSLKHTGTIAAWCNRLNCWFLFEYRKYSTGDWAWQHKMSHMAVGASGTYALINGC